MCVPKLLDSLLVTTKFVFVSGHQLPGQYFHCDGAQRHRSWLDRGYKVNKNFSIDLQLKINAQFPQKRTDSVRERMERRCRGVFLHLNLHHHACNLTRICVRREFPSTFPIFTWINSNLNLQKVSKKLHLSKFKLSRFNESGQLVVFYLMSFIWGAEVIIREQYAENMSRLWTDYPNHPMTFLHKLYFVIQLSYYLHMLPELYFQKIKRDEQPAKMQHSIAGALVIGFFYFFAYRRIAIVLLTLHYFSEFVGHTFGLLEVFDKDEKYVKCKLRGVLGSGGVL